MERQGFLFGDTIVSNITDDKVRGSIVKIDVNEDGFIVIKKRVNGVIRTLTYTGVEFATIVDSLNSVAVDKALSARQGNILNNKIDSLSSNFQLIANLDKDELSNSSIKYPSSKVVLNEINKIENQISAIGGSFSHDLIELKNELVLKINNKQDIISDLNTIRSNASKGANILDSTDFKFIINPIKSDLASVLSRISVVESTKQDELKSGINIKTINGNSILGNGDIEIKGGGSSYESITEDKDEEVGEYSVKIKDLLFVGKELHSNSIYLRHEDLDDIIQSLNDKDANMEDSIDGLTDRVNDMGDEVTSISNRVVDMDGYIDELADKVNDLYDDYINALQLL